MHPEPISDARADRRPPRRATILGRRFAAATVVSCLLALTAVVAAGLVAPAPARAGVAKGIQDGILEGEPAGSAARVAMVREIDTELGADWVRACVSWSRLEPERGAYETSELARLDALVADLHASGVKVLLTICYAPAWATDSYWWDHPPVGCAKGPQPFYPVRSDALGEFGDLGEFLAQRYKGRIQALECWNEPNMWAYLYPQRTAGDPYFGARSYLRLLKAFSAGVRRARTGVRIVAGATAPVGLNDLYRTSPQRFARFLRRSGAGRFFDVYSHHPYTPGGSLFKAPGRPPNDSSTAVTLHNLPILLRLFPGKPFYLTEYGYNTQPSEAFGLVVSERAQARYLAAAYRYAARYRQVRLLVWYLVRDARPSEGPADKGVYTGLRRPNGERKPSWHAFRRL